MVEEARISQFIPEKGWKWPGGNEKPILHLGLNSDQISERLGIIFRDHDFETGGDEPGSCTESWVSVGTDQLVARIVDYDHPRLFPNDVLIFVGSSDVETPESTVRNQKVLLDAFGVSEEQVVWRRPEVISEE